MTRQRRRRSPPRPRCSDCGGAFTWIRSPGTGNWRPFEPTPIDPRSSTQRVAYPVESNRAWLRRDLVEDLMSRRELSRDEAESYVLDLPWHAPHTCPPGPTAHDEDDDV